MSVEFIDEKIYILSENGALFLYQSNGTYELVREAHARAFACMQGE